MATIVEIEFQGAQELNDLFKQIQNDFGSKDASKILRNAVRLSMKPVLEKAKASAPKDTGGLAASLQVETRRPSRKDRGSKYIEEGDSVIGLVTTASGKKLSKRQFTNINTGEKESFVTINKTVKGKQVINNDQRAAAMEFGTSKVGSKPFLRSSLESSSQSVASSLGQSLKITLEKYKAKQAKKGIV